MSLVKCPECGKEISDQAASCPNCGMPMHQSTIKSTSVSLPQNNDLLHCPKCYSTNLHVDKKGFSGGKALAGAVVAGGIGILAGTIGSQDIDVTCLKCGHKFNPVKDLKKKQERERKIQQRKQEAEMWKENPAGMLIMLGCIGLAFYLLFGTSASTWWSILLIILSVLIPVFTTKKK